MVTFNLSMISIKTSNPDKAGVKKIAKVISKGGIAILPTSTIYGLSCRYDSKKAIEKIYKIKQRDPIVPFIILISGKDDLKRLVSGINSTAEKLIEKFWDIKRPRPLTMIFRRNDSLEDFMTCGSPNIALRLAGSRLLRDIIGICGPIVSTSATISGTKSFPKEIKDIPDTIVKKADLVVECLSPLAGEESTIIEVTGRVPVLVREGAVRFKEILNN
jgi:L-threonylcarbamoyladenylate synthase